MTPDWRVAPILLASWSWRSWPARPAGRGISGEAGANPMAPTDPSRLNCRKLSCVHEFEEITRGWRSVACAAYFRRTFGVLSAYFRRTFGVLAYRTPSAHCRLRQGHAPCFCGLASAASTRGDPVGEALRGDGVTIGVWIGCRATYGGRRVLSGERRGGYGSQGSVRRTIFELARENTRDEVKRDGVPRPRPPTPPADPARNVRRLLSQARHGGGIRPIDPIRVLAIDVSFSFCSFSRLRTRRL
jgi:hypothetical protein